MSNTQLTTTKASPLAVMAARFNADPAKLLDTLKATVFKEARNNEELQALVIVANQYGLNPLTKEIYAFPAKGGGIVPVVSIDGWANLANSHPQMDGVSFEWEHDAGKLVSCTAIIHRKDRSHPVRVTEYLAECRRNTDPWKMEHRMLRHKAFCQAVRIAFGFSGIVDEDEAQRFERDVTPQASQNKLFKEPVTLPVEAAPISKPALEELACRIADEGLTWPQVCDVMVANGILDGERATLEEAGEEAASDVLNAWDGLVKTVKGGAKA